jgi:UDP-N-acetylmuramate--L-alanine ligase
MDLEPNNLESILNKSVAKLYFIGIGGIAMSAAAGIAKERGFEVSGSDSKALYAPARDVLEKFKIPYFAGYDKSHAEQSRADVFILSAGEGLTNPEVRYVVENNLPNFSFAELLQNFYKNTLRLVVAGTHGKSTTAGLLGHLLKSLDNGSFMVGAVLQNYESNFYNGNGNYSVFEGDEYKSRFDDPTPKFHYYKPDILVLTNLEYDHPDLFESLQALEAEFAELIDAMPEDGLIVYNADSAVLTKLVHQSNLASVSFGIENEADYQAVDIDFAKDYTTIEVKNKFSKQISSALLGQTEQYKIALPGKMNVYNALAAIAALRALGFQQEQIALDLLIYKGVKRRFEIVGTKNGIAIIDDYAHHPTAVRETLEAARLKYPKSRIWAIFEPHTYSRTKATLPDLAKSFASADEVLISDIYPARETAKDATITSPEVVEAVRRQYSPPFQGGVPAAGGGGGENYIRLVHNKQDALNILKSETRPGDVIIVMAVGSFNRLAYELKEML